MSTARRFDPNLESALKKLRLGKMIPTLPERIALAQKSRMWFEELLLLVLRDEIDRRNSTATARCAKEAGLNPDMRIERKDSPWPVVTLPAGASSARTREASRCDRVLVAARTGGDRLGRAAPDQASMSSCGSRTRPSFAAANSSRSTLSLNRRSWSTSWRSPTASST